MIKPSQISNSAAKKLRLNQGKSNLLKIQRCEAKNVDKQLQKTKNIFLVKDQKVLKFRQEQKTTPITSSNFIQPLKRKFSNQEAKKQKLNRQSLPKRRIRHQDTSVSIKYLQVSRENRQAQLTFVRNQQDLYLEVKRFCLKSSENSDLRERKQKLREYLMSLFEYFGAKLQQDGLASTQTDNLWKKRITNSTEINTQPQSLSIFSQICSQNISFSYFYQSKSLLLAEQVRQLQKQKNSLQNQISSLTEASKTKTEQAQKAYRAIYELNNQYKDMKSKCETEDQKHQCILNQIHKSQDLLRKSKDQELKILNYVQTQQQKKILHFVSEAYKQIESNIYDFAAYLQCNAMASSLVWEPKPFRAVQQWIMAELQRLTKYLQESDEDNIKKGEKMAKFINDTTRKYRTKDEEMMKMMDYKTQCIRKYIKMMQVWLQNWDLKQEYLVNLRKEFAMDSIQISNLFDKIQTSKESNQDKFHLSEVDLNDLKGLWRKIELNYKYGNSFY